MSMDQDLDGFEVFAYVGEDEFGRSMGLKQGFTGAGDLIPLVAVHRHKLDREDFHKQIALQVKTYGKPIRLVRLVYAETVTLFIP